MKKLKAWLLKVWSEFVKSIDDLRGKPTQIPEVTIVKKKKSRKKR